MDAYNVEKYHMRILKRFHEEVPPAFTKRAPAANADEIGKQIVSVLKKSKRKDLFAVLAELLDDTPEGAARYWTELALAFARAAEDVEPLVDYLHIVYEKYAHLQHAARVVYTAVCEVRAEDVVLPEPRIPPTDHAEEYGSLNHHTYLFDNAAKSPQ